MADQKITIRYDYRRDASSVLLDVSDTPDSTKKWQEIGVISSRPQARFKRSSTANKTAIDELVIAELQRFYTLVLHKQYTYVQKISSIKLTDENMNKIHLEEERLTRVWHAKLAETLATNWDYRSDDVRKKSKAGGTRLANTKTDLVADINELAKEGTEYKNMC